MKTDEPCRPVHLAGENCCDVSYCPQCKTFHLRIGPLSVRLPRVVFDEVVTTLATAASGLGDDTQNWHALAHDQERTH
jgi:hypothetical protein